MVRYRVRLLFLSIVRDSELEFTIRFDYFGRTSTPQHTESDYSSDLMSDLR